MLRVSNNKNVKRLNFIISLVALASGIILFIYGLIAGGADMSN